MKKFKNVLSLFDGMSCGQIALKELGANVETYYASEIEKYPMHVTNHNFPNTIQLGDVRNVDVSKLKPIDLLIGGSPCQSFSFAGKRKGMSTKCSEDIYTLGKYLELKNDGFEFEGQSYLFWEYMRILDDIRKYNPDVKFLLENVEMGKKWERVLSDAIGLYGVHINSALVSAQNRKRIYWTNIRTRKEGMFGDLYSDIPQPKDKGILLKDILENEVDEKYFLSEKMLKYFDTRAANFNNGKGNIRQKDDKATTLTASMASCDISDNFVAIDANGNNGMDKSGTVLSRYHKGPSNFGSETFIKINTNLNKSDNQDKANCFTAGGNSGGLHSDMTLIVASRGINPENPKSSEVGLNTEQHLEPRFDGKTNCLTSVQKDNLVMQLNGSTESGCKQPYQQNRVYDTNGISPCLMAQMSCGTHAVLEGANIRRLTPTECKILQTVPDWYDMSILSDTQQYKALGNGWTIEVIKHILSH